MQAACNVSAICCKQYIYACICDTIIAFHMHMDICMVAPHLHCNGYSKNFVCTLARAPNAYFTTRLKLARTVVKLPQLVAFVAHKDLNMQINVHTNLSEMCVCMCMCEHAVAHTSSSTTIKRGIPNTS